MIQNGMLSQQGMQRDLNEDSMSHSEPDVAHDILCRDYVYIVDNGVGGRQAGEMVSQYIAGRMAQRQYQTPASDTREALAESTKLANEEIRRMATREDPFKAVKHLITEASERGGNRQRHRHCLDD